MHSNDYNITKHGNFFFAKAHDRTKVILKLLLRANLLLAQRTIDLIFGNLCLVALYVCMYVYGWMDDAGHYGCVHVCMYVCKYVCMYVHACVYACACMCMYVCMYECM